MAAVDQTFGLVSLVLSTVRIQAEAYLWLIVVTTTVRRILVDAGLLPLLRLLLLLPDEEGIMVRVGRKKGGAGGVAAASKTGAQVLARNAAPRVFVTQVTRRRDVI